MDSPATQASAAASASSYTSFATATRSVLDLLERTLPTATVFLAHLDHAHGMHRIVDVRRGGAFGLRSNLAVALDRSFCSHMAEGLAPRRCNDVPAHPLYGRVATLAGTGVAGYVGAPLVLSDGARVGALAAYVRAPAAFTEEDEHLFQMLARLLAVELERGTHQRDRDRSDEGLRRRARGLAAVNRLARSLADGGDARPAVCRAATEATGAPVAFLLEPAGTAFSSTAMTGVEIAPIKVQARAGDGAAGALSQDPLFIADARSHPALAAPLVEATGARSAHFEPVVRDKAVVGVLIVIWRTGIDALEADTADLLRLIAAQAAVAIEQAGLRARLEGLSITDPLTGVAGRRAFEEELPRELARSRRSDDPVCVAMLGLDHTSAFNMLRGEREGDRLIKEAAASWAAGVRAVDLIARLDGDRFAVLLPGCGLTEALEVVERLRTATPRGQTASAGVARWNWSEPGELLTARAEEALAAAKAAGRDRTHAAE